MSKKSHSSENIHSSSSANLSSKVNFFTTLFTLYLGLSLIRYIWPANLILTASVTILGLLSLALLSRKIPEDNVLIYIFMGLLATAFLVSSLFVLRTDRIGHVVLFIFFNFGIALILLRGHVHSQGVYLVFYVMACYMVFLIFSGVDPDEALKVTSHNGISEMMIVPCICLYIVQTNEGKEIDLKPAFFTLLISIWGIGRSGIISSFVLFAGLFLIKRRFNKSYVYSISLVLLVIYLFFDQLVLLGVDNAFFGRAINLYLARKMEEGPDSRIYIWANYFNNLDSFRIFFGANVLTDPWPDGEVYAYNYHNMFIHLHLQTGLMAIVFYILILLALVKFWRTNKVFFFLLLTICLRGMTDTFLLFESWDFILYFFIYYFLRDLYLSIKGDLRRSVPGLTKTSHKPGNSTLRSGFGGF
jgi:hypothetical protein